MMLKPEMRARQQDWGADWSRNMRDSKEFPKGKKEWRDHDIVESAKKLTVL